MAEGRRQVSAAQKVAAQNRAKPKAEPPRRQSLYVRPYLTDGEVKLALKLIEGNSGALLDPSLASLEAELRRWI